MQQPNVIEIYGESSNGKMTVARGDTHKHSSRQISVFVFIIYSVFIIYAKQWYVKQSKGS